MLRKASFIAVASLDMLGGVVLPTANAQAATVSRAELKGGVLRLDGVNAAPGIFVMVRSSSSLAGARSDGSGTYHVQANAGDLSTYYFATTGCDTSARPMTWSFLAGRIPVGMSGPTSQGQTSGSISGRPAIEGTYSFAIQVTDSVGATDTETFTIIVTAPAR